MPVNDLRRFRKLFKQRGKRGGTKENERKGAKESIKNICRRRHKKEMGYKKKLFCRK